ncbi:mammalian ependymin-related protein 1-like [Corticium candelabrum]|uniref:mammalian ependymin-related protein 1-like n=1 Tax=Corticium candelabrum TaxID=121492 RepID=UPI002E26AEBA|nr:mammalian ependymin-related protein 1-like [Corticium candelabrum]
MKFLLLALFITVAFAQDDREPCDSPPQWEGREFHIHYGEGGFTRIEKISYDETNERYRRIEEIEFYNHSRAYYDQLFIHKEQIGYSLNIRTRQCEKFPLTEPFQKNGVPEGATYLGTHYIGSSADPAYGVEVKEFSAYTERGQFHGTFTVNGCVPISHSYQSTISGYRTTRYFDVTLGIQDPNVFIPPKECQEL